MKIKQILLGLLIVMAMAIYGVFLAPSKPSVFATELPEQQIETITNEAGTFKGQGFYVVGNIAIVEAVMNPGYKFDGWVATDIEGNPVTLPTSETSSPSDLKYAFVVEQNLTINPTYSKIEYSVNFISSMLDGNELKDFDCEIVNNTQSDGNNYYGDEIKITLNVKQDVFIYDLVNSNIKINGQSVNTIAKSCTITNNVDIKTGLKSVVIVLNIYNDIIIDIDYTHMYKLQIVSGNDIDISEIIQFITISNHYSQPKSDEYIYLVREDKDVVITINRGDAVYEFVIYQFEGNDPDNKYSQSYQLKENKTLTVTYNKKDYNVSFNSYLINLYDKIDLLETSYYNIPNIEINAGDTIEFEYDENDKTITITDNNGLATEYEYLNSSFGFKFVGFAIDNQLLNTSSFTLSTSEPANIEIQLIFEYIKYSMQIQLVDEYFNDDATYELAYDSESLVNGTVVTAKASTNKYLINGWSWSNLPKEYGYVDNAENEAISDEYVFTFNPVSDDNSQPYILYLDVDYKYLTTTYQLKQNSIIYNTPYDTVRVDLNNKKLMFINSEELETSVEINYSNSDVSADGDKTIINTVEFGSITIGADSLKYSLNHIEVSSKSKITESGVDIYSFDKYTYFGDLQVGLLETISLTNSGDNVDIIFNGTIINDNTKTSGEIANFSTTKTYDNDKNAYLINYYYEMYLYQQGETIELGDYIVLNNINFYYDGEKFVLNNASINAPKPVGYNVIKNSNYKIEITNVLPNAIIMYYTKSVDDINYRFTTYTNIVGSGIWSFEDNGYNMCLLNATLFPEVSVQYSQLENDIILLINDENAYQYNNIIFVVEGSSGSHNGNGNKISAKDNETITITIFETNIVKGYEFDSFVFNGENVTDTNTPLIYTFIMDSRIHANQIININFTPIEYTININYIDKNGSPIEATQANGSVGLQGSEHQTSYVVTLVNEYTFEAVANVGYYVADAYIENTYFTLGSLIGSNSQTQLATLWQLDSSNFRQAIINNSNNLNQVNIYIYFAIHTYSIKVYFGIGENAGSVVYPTLYINDVEQTLIVGSEVEGGVATTKRYIVADGFEYNQNIELRLANFMKGTTLLKWSNSNGQQISTSNQYDITQIKQNITLHVTLQYVSYALKFVSIDEQGSECTYGTASSNASTYKLLDTITYTINTEMGYVLKEKYYFNSNNQICYDNIDETGFEFNPSNFNIENGSIFKIYLVFTLKAVNLQISNITSGTMYYFKNYTPSELASFVVSRERDGVVSELNDETGYQFVTSDILTIKIMPISIGLELNKVQLADINITQASESPYKFTLVDIEEDGKVVGMYYEVQISFEPGVISVLDENVELKNVLQAKTFNITYTYNYIEYDFDIALVRKYNGSTYTANTDGADEEIKINNVGFGAEVEFRYVYIGDTDFNVDGFTIAGIKQNVKDKFVFKDISLWEQVALSEYIEKDRAVTVVLVLKPKIVLNNYKYKDETAGYVYERSYIGENQGLVTTGVKGDVVVGGNFNAIIKYSYNGGVDYYDTKPIDVGEYPVKIIAKIGSSDSQITDVLFEEGVIFKIIPALVTIDFQTYNSTNPITKIYDGTNSLSAQIIAKDLKFNGIYARDNNNVFVDSSTLRAEFSDSLVNPMSKLYDINVFEINLLDGAGNAIQNYKLSSGQNVVFSKIGKINPRDLKITGFVVSNKVYDGTNQLQVDISNINYMGKLSTDSTKIIDEQLVFYLEDYTVGYDRKVSIDWSTALVGADSINYSITYDDVYINIHPYEITYNLRDYGTFKIVDVDKKCLIPIESKIIATVYDKGSDEYREMYSAIEGQISQSEKLKNCYQIIMQVGAVNQLIPDGVYVYIPKVNKTTKVIQIPTGGEPSSLEYLPENEYIVIKMQQGEALIAIVVRTTYLPLWLIIVIIAASIGGVGVIVAIFVAIRRKTKQKYSRYDKI